MHSIVDVTEGMRAYMKAEYDTAVRKQLLAGLYGKKKPGPNPFANRAARRAAASRRSR